MKMVHGISEEETDTTTFFPVYQEIKNPRHINFVMQGTLACSYHKLVQQLTQRIRFDVKQRDPRCGSCRLKESPLILYSLASDHNNAPPYTAVELNRSDGLRDGVVSQLTRRWSAPGDAA